MSSSVKITHRINVTADEFTILQLAKMLGMEKLAHLDTEEAKDMYQKMFIEERNKLNGGIATNDTKQ